MLIGRLLVLLDLVVDQPAGETGAGAGKSAKAGIAANGAENSAYSGTTGGAGQRALLRFVSSRSRA